MHARALALPALLLALPLAGCIGNDPPEVETTPAPPVPPSPDPITPGGVCQACRETPKVTPGKGGMVHAHDYWGGETRKLLASFESGLIPIPLFPDGKAAGTAIADYDLPKPSLVYEGASHLEILFDKVCPLGVDKGFWLGALEGCATGHPAITLYVDYLSAADEPGAFRQAGQARPGEPLRIPVAPTEADMPHQTKSLWLFRLYTGEANAFTYNLTITAVKGHDVVDWPPHPDVYVDNPERVVLEGDFVTDYKGLSDSYLYGSDGGWQYPERVITYGTRSVEVEVTLTSLAAPGGATPSAYYLDFRNASYLGRMGHGDLSGGRLSDETGDGVTFRFQVPVDEEGLDTPYGSKSRWAFRFMARFGDEQGCPEVDASLQQGCQVVPYQLAYHMRVVAKGVSASVPEPA